MNRTDTRPILGELTLVGDRHQTRYINEYLTHQGTKRTTGWHEEVRSEEVSDSGEAILITSDG